jgi:hypothetical protein
MSDRPKQLTKVQHEAYQLFLQKNTDYGDAFAKYGPIGVLVRIGDKIQRLQHISKTAITLVKSESLRDTLIDLHNYAAMAVILLDEDPQKINPPQIVIPNAYSDSSLSDNDQQTTYYVGTSPNERPEILERNYVTDHPCMMPQENGGRCSIT